MSNATINNSPSTANIIGTTNEIVVTPTSGGVQIGFAPIIQNPTQPGFFARLTADVTSVTGDGTQYSVLWNNATTDKGSNFNASTGVFTAPVAGLYMFTSCITISGILSSHTAGVFRFVSSAAQYRGFNLNPFAANSSGNLSINISCTVRMIVNETMQSQLIVSNGTKVINVLWGSSSSVQSFFSGALLC